MENVTEWTKKWASFKWKGWEAIILKEQNHILNISFFSFVALALSLCSKLGHSIKIVGRQVFRMRVTESANDSLPMICAVFSATSTIFAYSSAGIYKLFIDAKEAQKYLKIRSELKKKTRTKKSWKSWVGFFLAGSEKRHRNGMGNERLVDGYKLIIIA